ncbi:MAG: tyrosine recombinase XerC [Clostridia bacterium]|jgi:integrase/recombinase XerD|nr:tyrosine recombinase XerC [Clostridiaceae bacterium]
MSKFPKNMLPYYAEDFLDYIDSIQNKSANTIKEYYYDLLLFFRFLKKRRGLLEKEETIEDANVRNMSLEVLSSVMLNDFYAFLSYLSSERQASPSTRSRKVATLRSFFKYCHTKAKIIETNPANELESPKIGKRLPRYLELEESINLLKSIEGKNKERDYCMILLFLNCGLRLSELVAMNIGDLRQDNTLVVRGKGSKERTIYLTDSVSEAIDNYLMVRPQPNEGHEDALFLSERKNRISPKTVEYTVKKYIKKANLDPKKYSTHKLRHTAATLMYQHGDVDIRSLQEILGHESIATTEIYTHVSNKRLKQAVSSNPLANFRIDEDENES